MHVFSWKILKFIIEEIDTIPDLKYYLQDRLKYVRISDVPLNKELDAIGLYKMGNNSFPNIAHDFNNSSYWKNYLSTMSKERSIRNSDNTSSKWLDAFESLFKNNRKLFHNIPLGLHFTWVFAVISRRERAIMGKKFESVQKHFLDGRQSRHFAFYVPATSHWIVFYFSKHDAKEQSLILRKMVDQKLIQLIEDEDYKYAVFGIGIKISNIWPPTIMGITSSILIAVNTIKDKYSVNDIIDAKKNWGHIKSGEIKEFPSN